MSADPIKQKEYLLFRGLTSVNAYFVLRLAVGLLLLFPATMKARQLSTVPTLKEGLLNAYGVNFLAVEWEIFLGFWLILCPYPRQTRKFAVWLPSSNGKIVHYWNTDGKVSEVSERKWREKGADAVLLTSSCPIDRPRKSVKWAGFPFYGMEWEIFATGVFVFGLYFWLSTFGWRKIQPQ